MIRTLLIIAAAGLVLATASFGGAFALGGRDMARNGWEWTLHDRDGDTVTFERRDGTEGPAATRTLEWTGGQSLTGLTFWLGSDDQGRDMLSAIIYGIRTSLSVGAMSGMVALCIGMAVGLSAAYLGGRFDTVIMRIVDLQLSFPAILVALIMLAVLGKGVDKIIVALVIAQWAYYARTVRASAMVERRKEYVEAAICLALSHRRIVLRHILPNVLPPLIVVGTVQVAHAIALEATLSFLGVGLPVTEPSLGLLIATGFDYMLTGKYWISTYPGVALLITIVSINLVGDQLRDVLNPRLQK